MKRLLTVMYPELLRFPDWVTAKQAYLQARRQLGANSWFGMRCRVVLVVGLFLAVSIIKMPEQVGVPFILRWVLAVLIPLFLVKALFWLFRKSIRRSIREQLTGMGIPCCVHCGYNLEGNVSGVCPECGCATKA